jgi:hypothetical protein
MALDFRHVLTRVAMGSLHFKQQRLVYISAVYINPAEMQTIIREFLYGQPFFAAENPLGTGIRQRPGQTNRAHSAQTRRSDGCRYRVLSHGIRYPNFIMAYRLD